MAMTSCTECGKAISDRAAACPACGAPVADTADAEPRKPVIVGDADRICAQCGHVGRPRVRTPGHFALELVCWLAFLVPGLIYTIWRVTSRTRVCAHCSGAELVQPRSPRGDELATRFGWEWR